MPKFKSVLVKQEERMSDGRVKPGVTAFVPLDDAAKAMSICDKAIELGVYKPKDGESPKEMAEKLRKREQAAAARDRKPV